MKQLWKSRSVQAVSLRCVILISAAYLGLSLLGWRMYAVVIAGGSLSRFEAFAGLVYILFYLLFIGLVPALLIFVGLYSGYAWLQKKPSELDGDMADQADGNKSRDPSTVNNNGSCQ